MKKPAKYFNRTWRQDYHFFIGWERNQFDVYCKKTYGIDPETTDGVFGWCIVATFSNSDPIIIIWSIFKNRPDIIVHECVHAANKTFKMAGQAPSLTNDEVQAYLVQDLFRFASGMKD